MEPSPSRPSPDGPAAGLSAADLDGELVEALPDRQAMSTIDVLLDFPVDSFAMPVNDATAMNIQSPDSMAIADADQIVLLDQYGRDGS